MSLRVCLFSVAFGLLLSAPLASASPGDHDPDQDGSGPTPAAARAAAGKPVRFDRAWLTHRYEGLRTMALQTDGEAVLDTNNVSGAMQKVFADVGSYYLLGYYSTNPKLDGRFRRIRVEVKREDVHVRARPVGECDANDPRGARRVPTDGTGCGPRHDGHLCETSAASPA